MAMKSPSRAQNTDMMTEHTVTCLKLLNICMAETAGKIIRAETRSAPTRLMERTITTAMIIAKAVSYIAVGVPDARENSSSNVMENILL